MFSIAPCAREGYWLQTATEKYPVSLMNSLNDKEYQEKAKMAIPPIFLTFLNQELHNQNDSIFVHQIGYAKKVLQKFNMTLSKEAGNPAIDIEETNEPLRTEVPY